MLVRARQAGGMGLLMLLYPLGELALGLNGNDMTREYFYARIWAVPAGFCCSASTAGLRECRTR